MIFHVWLQSTFCSVIHPLMAPGEFLCAGEKKLGGMYSSESVPGLTFIVSSTQLRAQYGIGCIIATIQSLQLSDH